MFVIYIIIIMILLCSIVQLSHDIIILYTFISIHVKWFSLICHNLQR